MSLPAEMVVNVKAALAERAEQEDGSGGFAVWAENARAIPRFLACATQWRTVSAGLAGIVFIGLDYAACQVALNGFELDMTPDDWEALRVMETAAGAALNGADPGAAA